MEFGRPARRFLAERKTGLSRAEGRHDEVEELLPLTPFVLLFSETEKMNMCRTGNCSLSNGRNMPKNYASPAL